MIHPHDAFNSTKEIMNCPFAWKFDTVCPIQCHEEGKHQSNNTTHQVWVWSFVWSSLVLKHRQLTIISTCWNNASRNPMHWKTWESFYRVLGTKSDNWLWIEAFGRKPLSDLGYSKGECKAMILTAQIGSSFAYRLSFLFLTPLKKENTKNKIAYHDRLHHAYRSG